MTAAARKVIPLWSPRAPIRPPALSSPWAPAFNRALMTGAVPGIGATAAAAPFPDKESASTCSKEPRWDSGQA